MKTASPVSERSDGSYPMSQNFESFTATFEDGVAEGNRLLALLVEIAPNLASRCEEFSTPQQLAPINEYLVKRSKRYAYPYLEGFFSRVLKPTEFEAEIITLWGTDSFIENQSQYAPVCELDEEYQLVQFGYVTGDGDAWCLDLDYQEIIRIAPEADGTSAETARRDKSPVFPAFDYLTSFLRTDAQRRGWIPRA